MPLLNVGEFVALILPVTFPLTSVVCALGRVRISNLPLSNGQERAVTRRQQACQPRPESAIDGKQMPPNLKSSVRSLRSQCISEGNTVSLQYL